MNIKLIVTGNTHKSVTSNILIDDESSGTIQVERANFTRLCDLLFPEKAYTVSNSEQTPVQIP